MRLCYYIIFLGFMATAPAGAASVPHNFQPSTTALASEVNANFDALVQAINALEARTAQLETDLTTANTTINQLDSELTVAQGEIVQLDSELTTAQGEIVQLDSELTAANAKIEAIESNTVLDLGGFLFIDVDAQGRNVARFDGINVQITNGLGATSAVNGLGNLIVGYDTARTVGPSVCSQGGATTEAVCLNAGFVWAQSHKSGSHNIVGGGANSYSSYGGLLVGQNNVINQEFASVSGGGINTSSGRWSSVSGGTNNTASRDHSSVSGGTKNTASGNESSISGGKFNTASGSGSSVSGGTDNTASGWYSNVSGGSQNATLGYWSSISGGQYHTASGEHSSVSGGSGNIASGDFSSISGGLNRSAVDLYDWAAGTLLEDQ